MGAGVPAQEVAVWIPESHFLLFEDLKYKALFGVLCCRDGFHEAVVFFMG